MGYSLQGKRVLVTGSSGGIGRGLALELALRQGCEVLIHYHQRAEGAAETRQMILEGGGSCAGILQADFRQLDRIPALWEQQIDAIWPEGLDILVNNAGVVQKQALEDDDPYTLAAWHACMAVNLHAPRLMSHWAVPRIRAGGGAILHVSSIHAEKSNEYMAAYAASKAALESLTRSQALEYAPYGIRVNAVAPGVVPVERTQAAFAQEAVTQAWLERVPLPRLGTVSDIATACLPLLTNEWITGAVWQVDGGMMARNNMPPRERP